MNVLVQKTDDRDVLGIVNAMLREQHTMNIWDEEVKPLSEYDDIDLLIIRDATKLGYKTLGAINKKASKTLFIKSVPTTEIIKSAYFINSFPYCADDRRYPPAFYHKDYACDILYLVTYTHNQDRMKIFERIPKNLTFRMIGNFVESPHYIGSVKSPQELSDFCKSAKLCIDFNLDCGLDLLKIGCNVITDTENTIGIPMFMGDSIEKTIEEELNKDRPILNPYDKLIITYTHFLPHLYKVIEL